MQPPADLLADRLDQEPAIADHQAGTVQDGQRTAMPAPQQTEETKVRDGSSARNSHHDRPYLAYSTVAMASTATPSLRNSTSGNPVTTPALPGLASCMSKGSKAADLRLPPLDRRCHRHSPVPRVPRNRSQRQLRPGAHGRSGPTVPTPTGPLGQGKPTSPTGTHSLQDFRWVSKKATMRWRASWADCSW